MNLGNIFLITAASICIASGVLALLAVLILRCVKKISWPRLFVLALLLAFSLCCCGLYFGHQPLFTAWHRAQNDVLPKTGCLTYEPSFFRLYATYRMTRAEFNAWIENHPWQLKPFAKSEISSNEMKRFGIKEPDAAFATESAPNGKQLRVYFQNDVIYVSYFAM
jgi:hypothetical protein